jgi:hypothetical protein
VLLLLLPARAQRRIKIFANFPSQATVRGLKELGTPASFHVFVDASSNLHDQVSSGIAMNQLS